VLLLHHCCYLGESRWTQRRTTMWNEERWWGEL